MSTAPAEDGAFGARIQQRIAEMLGLVRGVLADGVVNDAEAHALRIWIDANPEIVGEWPVNVLARRLDHIFDDEHIDEDERQDLAELLSQIVGEPGRAGIELRSPQELPLTDPPPVLTFEGKVYVFTGKFASGSLAERQRTVVRLGGRCEAQVTEGTDYLVVGAFGRRSEKVQRAVELQREGVPVAIVSENHWMATLP